MSSSKLEIELNKDDIELLLNKYHFNNADFSKVSAIYQALLPLVEPKMFYVLKAQIEEIGEKEFFITFITLGKAVDEFQDVYLNKGCISEAYMVDCISMEILMKAYEEAIRHIQIESEKWVARIEFLGDTYPMELLPKLKEYVGENEVIYNDSLVLSPRKSVVMILPVSDTQVENVCQICTNCGNKNCSYRENKKEKHKGSQKTEKNIYEERILTYGYQQIFGTGKQKLSRK